MTNTETTTTSQTAAVAEQGAKAAPKQAKASKVAKKNAPKAKSARKTAAKQATPAATRKTKAEAAIPREYSKKAIVIEMLHAKGGASLDEIVAKTSWQRHTVRGLLSTLRSKSGLAVERFEREDGGHAYRIGK